MYFCTYISDVSKKKKRKRKYKRKHFSVINITMGSNKSSTGGSGSGSMLMTALLSDEERAAIVSSLHRVIKPFLLRRVKTDVAVDLPAKVMFNMPLIDIG